MRLKFLLAFWLSLSINIDSLSISAEPVISETSQTNLLNLSNQSYEQLNQVEALLERLVLVSNRNALKLPREQQAQVRTKIVELRQLVNKFKNNVAMSSSLLNIALFTQANYLFLCAIDQGLKDSLRHWPDIDLSSLDTEFSRGGPAPTEAQITEKLNLNQAMLARITEDSHHVGTNHAQRAYKRFCATLSYWWDKTAKPQYLIPASLLSYGAYYKWAPKNNFIASGFKYLSVDINSPAVVAGGIAMSAIMPAAKEYSKDYLSNHMLYTLMALGLAIDKLKDDSLKRADQGTPFSKALQSTLLGTYIAMATKDKTSQIGPWIWHKATNLNKKLQGLPVTKTMAEKFKDDSAVESAVTFDDIIGNDDIKHKFKLLAEYITEPEKFDSAGLAPERGYLLVGGSRAGKSFMAKALAGEVKKLKKPNELTRFFQVPAAMINSIGFKQTMDLIRADGPCIVFIDEIDLLNLNRADHGKPNELLSSMLTWMGGEVDVDPNKQIIILAATNRPDKIDPALRQHGRFGEIIPFQYPTYTQRLEFLVKKLNKNGIFLPEELIKQLAQETHNCPYDDLEAIMNNALQLALQEHRPVDQQDFQYALDQNVHHIANNRQALTLTDSELKIVAAHQTGRAIATMLLQPNERISMVTTLPINQPVPEQPAQNHGLYKPTVKYGTTLTYPVTPRGQFHNQAQLSQLIQLELAGHIAQIILLGSCSYEYQATEQERALELAMQITLGGFKITDLSKQNLAAKKDAALALIEQLKLETTKLLEANKSKLEQIYQVLLKNKIIRETDFYKLVA